MNINEFNENYLNEVLDKLSKENKTIFIFGESNINLLTQIKMGFLKVFFSGGGGVIDPLFIFSEELIQYQYNFIQLLRNLFRVGGK